MSGAVTQMKEALRWNLPWQSRRGTIRTGRMAISTETGAEFHASPEPIVEGGEARAPRKSASPGASIHCAIGDPGIPPLRPSCSTMARKGQFKNHLNRSFGDHHNWFHIMVSKERK